MISVKSLSFLFSIVDDLTVALAYISLNLSTEKAMTFCVEWSTLIG